LSFDPAALWGLASAGPSKLAETPFDVATVFDLKGSQTGAEQLPPGNNNDVKTGRNLVTTENLSNQAFCSVSLNRAPQAPGGRDSQAADRQLVRQNEQGGKTAVNPCATLVNLLKFGATADVFVSPETSQ
jgi:secreted protein with Ig-like and vWFA domain